MSTTIPATALQLRSLVRADGQLEVTLVDAPVPEPGADEVLLRIEATPLNPSDIGLLFGPADLSTVRYAGTPSHPVLNATVPDKLMPGLAGRVGQPMPVGNEASGVVVKTGSSPQARQLLGRLVAVIGGAMYAQYRVMPAEACLVLPEGTAAADGASCFVNPLTALGMVETMRSEGHTALVHTVGASNLGQMLQRICLKDGIGLVNLVRKPEQEALLRSQGAEHVCDTSAPDFTDRLTDALAATGATIAFDAIGGGNLASKILTSMEAALSRSASEYSRYGNTVHKQVYIYGALDTGPTEIIRNVGMFWGIGGWLLFPFLERIGPQAAALLRRRVADELKTTFASQYSRQVSLAEVLQPQVVREFSKRATGTKYLINPSLC
jgi:NADPH:quinone reductase-like Zn-dependent oxidoreductase